MGKDMGRLLVTGIPAGFENFVEELGVPIADEKSFIPSSDTAPPDIGRIVEVSKKHRIIFVPLLNKESSNSGR